VKLLPDTHLVLWAFDAPENIPRAAVALLNDERNELFFSVVSIWETAIKSGLRKKNFKVDAEALRRGLLGNGYTELPITGDHATAISRLPPIHKDPFDRMLIAQATVEGITFLTVDRQLAKYPGPIRKV
jgi:PIN domain nuclease of toxin-antitoxin system